MGSQNKLEYSARVRALQSYTKDVGKYIVRVDLNTMNSINISNGGFIEILGKLRTAAKCMPVYPADQDKGIARMDHLIRDNAGLEVGDEAEIRKVSNAKPCEEITLAPLTSIVRLDEDYVIKTLIGIPLTIGDKVLLPLGLDWVLLLILGIRPRSQVAIVNSRTRVQLLSSILK